MVQTSRGTRVHSAAQAGQVYPTQGPNGAPTGTGSSVDSCSHAIQDNLADINTICCKYCGLV